MVYNGHRISVYGDVDVPNLLGAPECGVCVLRSYICTKVCPLNLIFPIKIMKLVFKPKPAYITQQSPNRWQFPAIRVVISPPIGHILWLSSVGDTLAERMNWREGHSFC